MIVPRRTAVFSSELLSVGSQSVSGAREKVRETSLIEQCVSSEEITASAVVTFLVLHRRVQIYRI